MSTIEQSEAPADARSWFTRSVLLDAISAFARFFMAYTWISAGIPKLNDHMNMTQAITAYEIFTPQFSDLLARLIGPLEIAGGLMLLLGLFLRPASKLASVVLVLFIIGIAWAWIGGLVIDCGCFNIEPNVDKQAMDYFLTILRDIGFLALSVWTIYRPFKKFAIYP
ncbi:Methylamine utilization protein MauE [Corynebacterium atrinae]|uniref:MauE/DoxX family redox-associated membrane protein n=1 Tax=Corynebacterium atrinae TaxID=1336740 RepID=UPI003F492BF2|nr:Methylamine utilization protein MauE [Corynebacterium atrinae]